MPTKLVSTVAAYLAPYLDLHRLSGERYYFRKESTALRDDAGMIRVWHPQIEHEMLRTYHAETEGILYAAFPKSADFHKRTDEDLLYVGCSASGGARYWRGRPDASRRFSMAKSCFHHDEQMRRGRNARNLEKHLSTICPVRIQTLTDAAVIAICTEHQIVLPDAKYPSHQLEKAILLEGFRNWQWNARC